MNKTTLNSQKEKHSMTLLAESDLITALGGHAEPHISIHALLTESDAFCHIRSSGVANFYPRSPCGERPSRSRDVNPVTLFLSTLSLRRRRHWQTGHRRTRHFYPRSPCGERRAIGRRGRAVRDISIHALLAESDLCPICQWRRSLKFLSTLSLRRATGSRAPPYLDTLVNFYPRSPCGERRPQFSLFRRIHRISIHALLAESDEPDPAADRIVSHFYPRSPCGDDRRFCV